jgi:hypothetical protein
MILWDCALPTGFGIALSNLPVKRPDSSSCNVSDKSAPENGLGPAMCPCSQMRPHPFRRERPLSGFVATASCARKILSLQFLLHSPIDNVNVDVDCAVD